jgi:hypothetical protein
MSTSAQKARQETHDARRLQRVAAARKAVGLPFWHELIPWFEAHVPAHVHQGRLVGDLQVTQEAFDAAPGDEVQVFVNALGETVYRKKLLISGAAAAEIRLMCIEDAQT